ncbi:MAG: hypothetical protein BWY71_02056 [Planctomycetes bacterium ADurb.Bin412]|nr:MAG: hypothetical protein BWY71_02056 [Planctomycetes bacterium ADurb.Bin412]
MNEFEHIRDCFRFPAGQPLTRLAELVQPVVIDILTAMRGIDEAQIQTGLIPVHDALQGGGGVAMVPGHFHLGRVVCVDTGRVTEIINTNRFGGTAAIAE